MAPNKLNAFSLIKHNKYMTIGLFYNLLNIRLGLDAQGAPIIFRIRLSSNCKPPTKFSMTPTL